jgi:HEAT repeat protein
MVRTTIVLVIFGALLFGQTVKDVRAVAKKGASALPELGQFLKNPETRIRAEAVKSIVDIGTPKSIDLLIEATHDVDDIIQIRATDGLVNFYMPGYVAIGVTARIQHTGTNIKSTFVDRNEQQIEPYIVVRPEVVLAIGALVRGGSSMDSRANAARALGILRGRAALPDLLEGIRSKDSNVIFESLIAIQKIHDESAGPKVQFLLRDLKEKIQLAAIETVGILATRSALDDLRTLLATTSKSKVKRAALTAIAMMPEAKDRDILSAFLKDKDEAFRAAAAEGFARLRNASDIPMMQQAFNDEVKRGPRISMAFALVMEGQTELSETSALQFLINMLNQAAHKNDAETLLVEAAREPVVRTQLYGPMEKGTKDEKIGLAHILAQTGDRSTEPYLEKVSRDGDKQVAEEGLRALRNLRARL